MGRDAACEARAPHTRESRSCRFAPSENVRKWTFCNLSAQPGRLCNRGRLCTIRYKYLILIVTIARFSLILWPYYDITNYTLQVIGWHLFYKFILTIYKANNWSKIHEIPYSQIADAENLKVITRTKVPITGSVTSNHLAPDQKSKTLSISCSQMQIYISDYIILQARVFYIESIRQSWIG